MSGQPKEIDLGTPTSPKAVQILGSDGRASFWNLSRPSRSIGNPIAASHCFAKLLDAAQKLTDKLGRLLSHIASLHGIPCTTFLRSQLLAFLLVEVVSGRDIPPNVKSFYDSVVTQGKCKNVLAGGFHSSDGDSGTFSYCGDHIDDYNIIYIQGKHGELANQDVDCDGIQGSHADNSKCKSYSDTQSITSFQDIVTGYGTGQEDLDANIHPYVVFGNTGTKRHWPIFEPQDYDIKPLSVIAVVCGHKLIYGIWGDENGDDDEEAMVGEVSISLATACYGTDMNGDNGHDDNDVLYIAFPGHDAVPGMNGASWTASKYDAFEDSITNLGDELIARIGDGSSEAVGKTGLLIHGRALLVFIVIVALIL